MYVFDMCINACMYKNVYGCVLCIYVYMCVCKYVYVYICVDKTFFCRGYHISYNILNDIPMLLRHGRESFSFLQPQFDWLGSPTGGVYFSCSLQHSLGYIRP